jgi:ABC-type phosphate transport system auxiliary subunit
MAGAKLVAQHNGAPLLTVDELTALSKTAADLIERMDALRSEFEQAHAVARDRNDQLAEIIRSAVAKVQTKDPDTP